MNTLFTIICLTCGFCAVNGSVFDFFRSRRQSSCGENDFACNSGQCIEQFSVCDGKKDCRDGSDETHAICERLEIKCLAYTFRCAYGACVDGSAVCDGRRDCVDNSDELLPECLKNVTPTEGKCRELEFMCASGQCIDTFSVCDGVADCNDKTDETITQCVRRRCPEFSFQCAYGACIDGNKKCNGVANDCADGSDEDEELCNNPVTPRPTRPPLPPTRTLSTSPPSKRPSTTSIRPIIPPFDTSSVFCALPKQPEAGSYQLASCQPSDRSPQCQNKQGTPVPKNSILIYTCNEGYVLSADYPFMFCLNGDWNIPPLECNKECSKLVFDSLNIECTYKGEPVDCSKKMKPGTKAKGKCKHSYRIPEQSLYRLNKDPVCLQNGTWDEQFFRCVPECGKRNYNAEQTLINGGNATKVGEFPWHAGLYGSDDNTVVNSPFTFLCGGSIISSRAILTAAHCVFKNGRGKDPTTLKVAVGKYNSSWENTDIYEQRFAVKQIILPIAYNGKFTGYAQDISILELDRAIQFGTAALPVCVDWHSQIKFQINSYGYVVGWGLDEHKKISDVLKLVQMQVLDYETCYRNSPKHFKSYITYDKFCTNYNEGQGVQQGDSGGGLTFEQSGGLHFIYGIVSVKPRDENTFAAFTNITKHIEWIRNEVNAVNKKIQKSEQD